MVAFISCAILSFSATTVAAQTNASVAAPISMEDLPQVPEWKSPTEYSAVLVTERANAAQILAAPTTKELAFALYTGYDRMLSYMETDMAAGVPIEKIAVNNFNKVNQEAISDPALVNMQAAEFNALYEALLVMLHQ
ncbi:MAG: hypothetical protein ACKVU0_05390 [Saprospiraceae bacterium]